MIDGLLCECSSVTSPYSKFVQVPSLVARYSIFVELSGMCMLTQSSKNDPPRDPGRDRSIDAMNGYPWSCTLRDARNLISSFWAILPWFIY